MLEGPEFIPHGKIEKIIITLHGYGANGENLLDFGRVLAENTNFNTAVYSPNAIEAFDMGVSNSYQWFGLPDLAEPTISQGVNKSLPMLINYIDKIAEKHELGTKDIILFGFSQGCMMTLTSIYFRNLYAAIGVAGMFIQSENRVIPSPKTPVLLCHGTYDMVVPYPSMAIAEEFLKSDGVNVQTISSPGLGHSIDDKILTESINFLNKLKI